MMRRNHLTKKQIICSKCRIKRNEKSNDCPFCICNLHMIEKPLYTAFGDEIKVIKNKYPLTKNHYVVIDTKDHNKCITHFDDLHLYHLMNTFKYMIEFLEEDKTLKSVQIFKNNGENAGATKEHSHFQITAMKTIPAKENVIKKSSYNNEKCYLCSENHKNLVVYENKHFIAFCPKDSVYSYEIDIMPKAHIVSMLSLDCDMLKNMGISIRESIILLKRAIKNLDICNDVDFNICIYNALIPPKYHIFVQIIPRIYKFGGFELATDMYANSISPYDFAKFLNKRF